MFQFGKNKVEVKKSGVFFKERANEILGVFTTTKNELAQLVEEQKAFYTEVEDEIIKLEQEKALVGKSINENASIISKIEKLLS